jgi:hypothetical protein
MRRHLVALVLLRLGCSSAVVGGFFSPPLPPQLCRVGMVWHFTAEAESGEDDYVEQAGDLFDYFDPLLSPHAYPNGIRPTTRSSAATTTTTRRGDDAPVLDGTERIAHPPQEENEYEYYDPLRFPSAASASPQLQQRLGGSWSSSRRSNRFGFVTLAPPELQQEGVERPVVDTSTTFDPTLSPHMYTKGVPDVIVGDPNAEYVDGVGTVAKGTRTRIGILLMDHGSRNAGSNQRLHELAALYQETLNGADQGGSRTTATLIVRAAHMEIATPTIPDGIQPRAARGGRHPPHRRGRRRAPGSVPAGPDHRSGRVPDRDHDPSDPRTRPGHVRAVLVGKVMRRPVLMRSHT